MSDEYTLAIKDNDFDHVKELLTKYDPSVEDNFALRLACYYNRVKIVKLLLNDKRVDPSLKNNHALRLACYYGNTEIVKILLKDKRVVPSAEENKAIRIAFKRNHKSIVRLLINDPRIELNVSERSTYTNMSRQSTNLRQYFCCIY